MQPFDIYKGTGKVSLKAEGQVHFSSELRKEEFGNYLADNDLADAVNTSICVGQPLLLAGEPGCGKTKLAWSVAKELGLGEVLTFYTRSDSKAQDLLYSFDTVRRFYDVQMKDPAAGEPANYVYYNALGEAITGKKRETDPEPDEAKCRVVLIDEIDKAPRDFPNDLLHELDQMEFEVKEVNQDRRIKKAFLRPIVIITSNSERQLPLPFLRRCVFFYIDFPSPEKLKQIVRQRLGHLHMDDTLIDTAIHRFTIVRGLKKLYKKPSTSELLIWLEALYRKGISANTLDSTSIAETPIWQALIKDRDDFLLRLKSTR